MKAKNWGENRIKNCLVTIALTVAAVACSHPSNEHVTWIDSRETNRVAYLETVVKFLDFRYDPADLRLANQIKAITLTVNKQVNGGQEFSGQILFQVMKTPISFKSVSVENGVLNTHDEIQTVVSSSQDSRAVGSKIQVSILCIDYQCGKAALLVSVTSADASDPLLAGYIFRRLSDTTFVADTYQGKLVPMDQALNPPSSPSQIKN